MASNSRNWRSILSRSVGGARLEEMPASAAARTALRDAQDRTLVARVRHRGDVRTSLERAFDLLDLPARTPLRGESVLLLPRFGRAPAPFSTAPDFLRAVVSLMRDHGAAEVRVLDARGPGYTEPAGLAQTCAAAGCELIDTGAGEWVRVRIGRALEWATVPRVAYDASRLVLLPSPLANPATRFTMGLALAQELLHPDDRGALRRTRREETLVEMNLAVRPWLVLMDARRALVSGEGDGVVREPGYVLAGGDPVAVDVAAVKLLKGYPAKNRLDMPAWAFPQVTAAIRLGLGASREDETRLLEG